MALHTIEPHARMHHSTVPPRITGGNLDCKELVSGSTLYLPIAVPGGLFSVGDGHARQGGGESCVTAIECPMDRVKITFQLHPDLHLTMPRAHTPAGWVTFGLHENLEEAALIAVENRVDLLMQNYGLERPVAFGLTSVLADLTHHPDRQQCAWRSCGAATRGDCRGGVDQIC